MCYGDHLDSLFHLSISKSFSIQKIILLHHFIQVIIVPIAYSTRLYYGWTKTKVLFVQDFIDVYQLECGFFMLILYIILSYYARIIDRDDCMNNAMTMQGNVCIIPLHWCLSFSCLFSLLFLFGHIDNNTMHFK